MNRTGAACDRELKRRLRSRPRARLEKANSDAKIHGDLRSQSSAFLTKANFSYMLLKISYLTTPIG
jgi:hypothetical protein